MRKYPIWGEVQVTLISHYNSSQYYTILYILLTSILINQPLDYIAYTLNLSKWLDIISQIKCLDFKYF